MQINRLDWSVSLAASHLCHLGVVYSLGRNVCIVCVCVCVCVCVYVYVCVCVFVCIYVGVHFFLGCIRRISLCNRLGWSMQTMPWARRS